jgi:formate dehydrogenase major subunit
MPVYYETTESPYENKLWEQTRDPGLVIVDDVENPIAPVGEHDYPTIMTTYHVTEHWLSGAQTRTMPWLVGLQPERFLELSPEQAASIGVETGDYVTVESERTKLQIRALVTPRLRIGEVYGQKATVVGAFVASGYKGLMVSDITNDLSPAIMASDGLIPASKGFAVRITKADPNDLQKLDPYPLEYDPLFDEPIPDTPWPAQPEGRN